MLTVGGVWGFGVGARLTQGWDARTNVPKYFRALSSLHGEM